MYWNLAKGGHRRETVQRGVCATPWPDKIEAEANRRQILCMAFPHLGASEWKRSDAEKVWITVQVSSARMEAQHSPYTRKIASPMLCLVSSGLQRCVVAVQRKVVLHRGPDYDCNGANPLLTWAHDAQYSALEARTRNVDGRRPASHPNPPLQDRVC